MSDLYADPYVIERDMLFKLSHKTVGEISQTGIPVKFLNEQNKSRNMSAPPLLGEHTSDILKELGLPLKEDM